MADAIREYQSAVDIIKTAIENGDFKILGYASDGSVITEGEDYEAKIIPGTNWQIGSHNASEYGTKIINSIIGQGRFSFPKSLYAVQGTADYSVDEGRSRWRMSEHRNW